MLKIRTLLTILILTSCALTTLGQYPFEKYPSIKYKEYKDWKVYDRIQKENKIHYTLTVPGFYSNHDATTIQLTAFAENDMYGNEDSSYIRIFRNKKQIQKIKEPYGFGGALNQPQSIFVEDINGDSLRDLKILIPYYGCGAYNYYLTVIYLFQKTDGTFTKISFTDLMTEFENRPERDIEGDGNYEIITQTFQNFGNHNYWVFNLYDFNGDSLTNVNYKYNYPIMVQLLYRENHAITDKISRDKMKDFARKLPDEYDKK